jgi:hypothetical protein
MRESGKMELPATETNSEGGVDTSTQMITYWYTFSNRL